MIQFRKTEQVSCIVQRSFHFALIAAIICHNEKLSSSLTWDCLQLSFMIKCYKIHKSWENRNKNNFQKDLVNFCKYDNPQNLFVKNQLKLKSSLWQIIVTHAVAHMSLEGRLEVWNVEEEIERICTYFKFNGNYSELLQLPM